MLMGNSPDAKKRRLPPYSGSERDGPRGWLGIIAATGADPPDADESCSATHSSLLRLAVRNGRSRALHLERSRGFEI
jgi:hypothetical protein